MRTKTITDSYNLLDEDEYLGIDTDKPITVLLPDTTTEGRTVTLKIEMKPPLAHRFVTIKASTATIDGYGNKLMQVSNEVVRLIYHNEGWRLI